MLRSPLALGGSPPGDDWKDGRDFGQVGGKEGAGHDARLHGAAGETTKQAVPA